MACHLRLESYLTLRRWTVVFHTHLNWCLILENIVSVYSLVPPTCHVYLGTKAQIRTQIKNEFSIFLKEFHFLLFVKVMQRVLSCNQRKVCRVVWVGEGEMLVFRLVYLLPRLLSLKRSFKRGDKVWSNSLCVCCPNTSWLNCLS